MKKSGMLPILLLLLAGLGLLLYPRFSDTWNTLHQSQVITGYGEAVQEMDIGRYAKILEKAHTYNEELFLNGRLWALEDKVQERYLETLDISGSGIMGYIEIPSIRVTLPIYHGTSDKVLQEAIGHVAWSSLPAGGENTHAVLSGHRGLPSAKLFTNLDDLEVGDRFMIHILSETLTYEVDRILTVKPTDTSELEIVPGMDLVTLVTCTPYGINTHRLLVRGHRVDHE